MATQPIDLSAGLIPKQSVPQASSDQGIDLSAGFVPRPSVPQSMLRNQWENLKATGKEVGSDLGKGIAEGAGQTVGTVSKLINKIPYVGETLAPLQGVKALQQMSTPEDASQKVGAGLEQAGEMALTGGPMRAGAEALATRIPSIAKYLAPALRIAAESANTGGSAALHGEPVGPAALTGGTGQAVGEALPAIAPALKKSAIAQYSKFLNPTKETTKNMAENVVPGLLDRGIVTTSGPALGKMAASKASGIGNEITNAVQNVPATTKPNTGNIIDALERYKQASMVNGVPVNEAAVKHASDLQDMVRALGPNVSYQSLNKARQILDSTVAQSGAYYGKTLAEGSAVDAQKQAANAMRAELAKQSPDVAKLNGEFHFWRQVQDVIGATNERRVGQQGGLGRIFSPLIGAGAGYMAHGSPTEAALASASLLALNEAVRSPLWRTAAPVLKNKIADAIAAGRGGDAMKIISRIGVGVAGQSQESNKASQVPAAQ